MFEGKGMEMMIRSLLKTMGVDATKIENCLDAGTLFFANASETMKRFETKLDLILSRTEPKDAEQSIMHLSDGTVVTGTVDEVLRQT